MKANLKVILEGRGALTLRESNYVTSGGEGAIYRAEQTVIKVYADPKKMIRDGMADKVKLLAAIKHPVIAAPAGIVTDDQQHPIGFYMPFVEGEPMPRVFTGDYRTRTGFDDRCARALTQRMQEATQAAHDGGAIMVDANEFNWIVEPGGMKPHVIDVDSWAIGRWPATVIMPSIRDWHASSFNDLTDWFSWGVVAFQVFTGIHPYKGKVDGYKPGELERRMKDNVSVFAPGVRLPAAARDPACIPGPLLDWFKAEFQDGERSRPPAPLDQTKPATAARVLRATTGPGAGMIHERLTHSGKIVYVWPCGVALTEDGRTIDLDVGPGLPLWPRATPSVEIISRFGRKVIAGVDGGILSISRHFGGDTFKDLPFNLDASRFFRAGNQLFAVTDREIVELDIDSIVAVGRRWGIRPNATQFFDSVAVQDVLGAAFLVLPTDAGLVQQRVPELDGLTPISGAAGGRFAAIVAADAQGVYRRFEFTFSKDFDAYTAWTGPNDGPDLNMVILPTGVVATIVNDGELILFVPTNGNINKIQDRDITTGTRLYRWNDKAIYIRDGDVWRLRVR